MVLKIKAEYTGFITLDENLSLSDALNEINKSGYNVSIVVDKHGKPVGIVTKEVIIKARSNGISMDTSLHSIMRKTIITITGKEDPLELLNLMIKNNLDYLVIVNNKGVPTGLVSVEDVFNTLKKLIRIKD